MSEITKNTSLMINCFPDCSEPKIINSLRALLPCLDITRLKSSFILNTNGTNDTIEKDKFENLLQISKDIQSNKGSLKGISQNNSALEYNANFCDNIFGFFSMLTATADFQCNNIPIFNSPQIAINNSSGWTHEQSLLQFVKTNITGKGVGAILLDATGWKDIVNGAIDEIERFASLAGWSARLSPYFSLLDQPFNDKARISIETKLINDSAEHATNNAIFLDYFIRGALIGTKEAKTSEGKNTGNSFIGSWLPPSLFNVGLKYGATSGAPKEYVKRYFYCTLEATVSPEGLMREIPGSGRVPDAYSLNLNFTSLLPDTLDTWRGSFLNHLNGK